MSVPSERIYTSAESRARLITIDECGRLVICRLRLGPLEISTPPLNPLSFSRNRKNGIALIVIDMLASILDAHYRVISDTPRELRIAFGFLNEEHLRKYSRLVECVALELRDTGVNIIIETSVKKLGDL